LGILPAKVVILLISSSYQQNVTVVIVTLSPNNLGFIDKWRYHYTTSGLRHYLKLGISIYWSLDYLMNPFGTAAVAEMITEKKQTSCRTNVIQLWLTFNRFVILRLINKLH